MRHASCDLPPGISSTSTAGAFVKVCVGTISWPKDDETKGFGSGFVDTGSSDSAIMESSILWFRDSTFRVLRGPKTSVVAIEVRRCDLILCS